MNARLEVHSPREHMMIGLALGSALASWRQQPSSRQELGGAMSLQDRIESLRARHRSLEEEIDREFSRPLPNVDHVADLKRQKLRIKDEIAQLEHITI
jgi:hypothetical protein